MNNYALIIASPPGSVKLILVIYSLFVNIQYFYSKPFRFFRVALWKMLHMYNNARCPAKYEYISASLTVPVPGHNPAKEVKDMNDAPVGFLMALSRDERAMSAYARLPKGERRRLIDRAKRASSHEEMQSIVSELRAQG